MRVLYDEKRGKERRDGINIEDVRRRRRRLIRAPPVVAEHAIAGTTSEKERLNDAAPPRVFPRSLRRNARTRVTVDEKVICEKLHFTSATRETRKKDVRRRPNFSCTSREAKFHFYSDSANFIDLEVSIENLDDRDAILYRLLIYPDANCWVNIMNFAIYQRNNLLEKSFTILRCHIQQRCFFSRNYSYLSEESRYNTGM